MYRQVQCLYCPSGYRHRLRSRPCTHGPGAAASLQVSTRTRAPFSRAPGLGDTGGRVPSACPTAAPRPPWPAGSPPSRRGCARQGSQATSQLLLSIRGDPRGARHGPRRAGTVGTRGLSLSSGTGGGRRGGVGGERGRGPRPICSSPAQVPVGRGGASARWHVHRRQWTRCCGAPGPGGSWNRSAGLGQGRASHPSPQEARADGTGTGWDAMGRDGTGWGELRVGAVTSLLPPARPPAGPLPH